MAAEETFRSGRRAGAADRRAARPPAPAPTLVLPLAALSIVVGLCESLDPCTIPFTCRSMFKLGSNVTNVSYAANGASRPLVLDCCCTDFEYGDFGAITWRPIKVNHRAEQDCPYGQREDETPYGIAKAYRRCIFYKGLGPTWAPSDYSQCKRKDKEQEEAEEAIKNAASAEQLTEDPNSMTSETFWKAAELCQKSARQALTNRTVARYMLKAMSNMMAVPSEVMTSGEGNNTQRVELYRLLEYFGRTVVLEEGENTLEEKHPNLHLLVHLVDTRGPAELPPRLNFTSDDIDITLPSEAVWMAVNASSIPGSLVGPVRVRFMTIQNPRLLQPPGKSSTRQRMLNAAVSLGVNPEVPEEMQSDFPVMGLTSPVIMQMPLAKSGVSHHCAYFDMNTQQWSTEGLNFRLVGGDTAVCESTHLTPFTLLLDPYPRRGLGNLRQALDIVGYVGSTLSVLCLAATILTYQLFRRFRDRWGRVLVQLCVSLLLLHLFYLASNLKGTLPEAACVGVAVLVHLLLLSSFCWMLVEALLLYQLLITVFQSANSKFILKRLVFAWGLPVVVVVVCAAVDPSYYEDTHPDFCLTSGSNALQHFLVLVVPCCIILVANFLIFCRVTCVLLRRSRPAGYQSDGDEQPRVTWAQVRGVVGVAFLLGVTWMLSPLAVDNAFMQVLSSALNASQGVAIFVSRVLTHAEARRSWSHKLFPRTEFGTTSASYSLSDKGSSWFRIRWSVSSGPVAAPPPLTERKKSAKLWCNPRSSATSNSTSTTYDM